MIYYQFEIRVLAIFFDVFSCQVKERNLVVLDLKEGFLFDFVFIVIIQLVTFDVFNVEEFCVAEGVKRSSTDILNVEPVGYVSSVFEAESKVEGSKHFTVSNIKLLLLNFKL